MSDFDQDALAIYRGAFWLNARMTPNYGDVEVTDVYKRGRELAELCENEDRGEHGREVLRALLGFELPEKLDELSDDQLKHLMGVHLVIFVFRRLPRFREAWSRRLENLPFPIRVENARFMYRTWKGQWEENEEYSAALQNHTLGF